MPTWYQFQPTLSGLVQDGVIDRELQEGLDSDIIFSRYAAPETISGRIGTKVKIPVNGRKAPVTKPLNGAGILSNLDNGMTPSMAPVEFFDLDLNEWGDTSDVDILGSLVAVVDLVTKAARDNGVQAAQSIDRLARICLFGTYFGGNTFVRPDLGNNTSSTIHVDDIRGFQFVQVSGELTPVSSGNPLKCFEVANSSNGVIQSFNVIGATADSPTNSSLFPGSGVDPNTGNLISDGISGTLTISGAAAAPVQGDAIIAGNAQRVVRPGNIPSSNMLTSQDVLTFALIRAAKAKLANNNVPRMPDGTYHLFLDATSESQLYLDPEFLTAFTASHSSQEITKGQLFVLFGITFIPTVEMYVQPPHPELGMNCTIRRSLMIGRDPMLKAEFDGLDSYYNQQFGGADKFGEVMMVDDVAQIIRPPQDRLLRLLSLSWTWIGSFTARTDGTATPLIIPTASNALYKRGVGIETGS